MNRNQSSTMSALLLGLATTVITTWSLAGPQFSADMVQQGPGGQSMIGKMIVGEDRVRMETDHQGQKVVRISDEERAVEWLLFPEQQRYMEHRLSPPGEKSPPKPSAEDPCVGMPGLTCSKTGEESVAGRAAAVWEIVVNRQGEAMTGRQWIDKERGPSFMLRQELPTGQKMERSFVGQEDLNGRSTEKWKVDTISTDGRTASTLEWYDPELGIAIKQEFPDGRVSELSSIRLGPQPDQLFGVPAGYERMAPPPGMSGQRPRR